MLSKLKSYICHPFRIFEDIFEIYAYPLIVALKPAVTVRGRIRVRGPAIIEVVKGASLTINNNVTLDSKNRGYHINMHSPVKIIADRTGAAIVIGENTKIHGACIHAYNSVTIGKNCLIAANTQIIDGNGHDLSFPNVHDRINTTGDSKPIVIEDNVWIGANCIILPGVSIAKGSVIAAGSVVTKDIAPYVVAGGTPAKVIKDYSSSLDN